ncbi:MAG: HAD-IA family hydrolase [Acidobacteria bacterium]|nr:HAD-IA family hydrolase [Acidobacteriota bacterium]
MRGVLVFDVDGVLVDVTDSYRETIIRTIEHFTSRRVTRDDIQQIKNLGGYNDDWALCKKVIQDFGCHPKYQEIVDHFQRIFLGENSDGLILRERWVARDGLFEQLAKDWRLAIFTGRTRSETRLTLDRFGAQAVFDPLIGNDDVENLKPAPDGLLKICATFPGVEVVYVGDTVDDAKSAGRAGVGFIGVAPQQDSRRAELVELFRQEGARAVVDNINELEQVLK